MSCKSRLKLLALATACLFTFQNIVAAAPSIPSVSHSSSTNFSDLYPYVDSLPSEMGILKESYLPSEKNASNPFVIHIQDAHANPEAQSRIRDVLFWLKDHAPSKNIVLAVEGSAGPIHPEYFNFFEQYPEANQAVVSDLHRKGEISGVELFAWEQYKKSLDTRHLSPEKIKIVGVEDVELYRDNLANYRELIFKQDEIDTALKPLRSQLEITKSKILNPRLRDFLRQKDEAKNRLHAYIVNDLATQTQKILSINLKDRIEQIRFPNLTRVIFLDEIEKKVNLVEAQKQWGNLRKEFEKAGVDKALLGSLEAVLKTSKDFESSKQSLRQIFEAIFSNPKAQAIHFEKYSSYIHWTAYTLLSQEIQSEELFEEVSRLQDAIAEKLAETEKEKEYLSLDKNYSLFEHLLHLELTRPEYEKLSTNSAAYRAEALSKQIWNLNPNLDKNQINFQSLNQFSDQSLRFYQNARKRDEALLSKALKSDPKASVVVLVTGGFHTEGLTALMKERMIPYAVIAPRMTSADDHQLYHKVLRRENADVSQYMKDPSLTKQEALFLKGIFEQAVPVLAQKYQLALKDLSQQAKEAVNRHPVLMNRFQAETFVNRDQQSVLRLSPNPVSVLSSISNKAVAEILLSSDRYAALANQSKNIQAPVVSDLTFTSRGGVSVRDVSAQRVDLGAGKNRVTVTSGPLESLGITRSETRSEIKEIAERIFQSLKGELGTYEFVQDEVMLLGDTDAVRMLVYSWAAAAKLPADPEIIVDAVVELIRKDSAEDPKSNARSEVRNQSFFNPEATEEEKNEIFDQRIQEVLEHIRTTDPQSYAGLDGADLVIAIPFYREKTTPRPLVDSLRQALQDPLFAARKTSIVFITEADTESSDELHQMVEKIQGDFTDPQYGVKSGKISILYFSKPYEILPSDVPHEPYRGKPWTVRAAIQVASLANKGQSADLVILDADLIFTNKKESAKKLLLALLAPLEIESQSQMSPLWQTEDLQHPADIVTLDARRVFRYDDGIVHLFTYLMYDSFFGLQVPEAHGGDFSLSKRYIRQLIESEEWRSLIQTDAYELESQLALRAQGMGMKVAAVEMSGKTHTLVESAKIFSRLTQVINPLFLDVLRYGRLAQNLSLQTWARTERPALGIEDVFDGLYRRDLGEGIKSVLKQLEDVDSSLGRGRQIFPEILGELWGYKLGYGGPGKVFDRGIGAADWGYATAKYLDRLKNELESGHEVLGPLALSYKLMIYLGALSFGNHILTEFKQWDQATKYLKEDFSPKFKEEAQKGFQRSELRSDVRAVFDRFLESVHPDEFIKSSHPNTSKPWVFRQFQPKVGGMIDVMIAVEADHLRFNVYHRGEREGSLKVRQKFNFGNKDTQVAIQQQGAWYDQIYRGNNPIQDIRFDNELQILTVTVTPGFYEFWNRFNRDFPKKLGPLLDTWPIKFEEQASEQRPVSRSEVRNQMIQNILNPNFKFTDSFWDSVFPVLTYGQLMDMHSRLKETELVERSMEVYKEILDRFGKEIGVAPERFQEYRDQWLSPNFEITEPVWSQLEQELSLNQMNSIISELTAIMHTDSRLPLRKVRLEGMSNNHQLKPQARSEVRLPATDLPNGQGQARNLQVELSDHTILLKENDELVSKLQIRATLLDEGEGGYVNASTVFKTIDQLQGAKKIIGWQAAKDRDGFTLDLEDGSAIYVMEKGATFFPARSEVRKIVKTITFFALKLAGGALVILLGPLALYNNLKRQEPFLDIPTQDVLSQVIFGLFIITIGGILPLLLAAAIYGTVHSILLDMKLRRFLTEKLFENDPSQISKENLKLILTRTSFVDVVEWDNRRGIDAEVPSSEAILATRVLFYGFFAGIRRHATPERIQLLNTYRVKNLTYDLDIYRMFRYFLFMFSEYENPEISNAAKQLLNDPSSQFYEKPEDIEETKRLALTSVTDAMTNSKFISSRNSNGPNVLKLLEPAKGMIANNDVKGAIKTISEVLEIGAYDYSVYIPLMKALHSLYSYSHFADGSTGLPSDRAPSRSEVRAKQTSVSDLISRLSGKFADESAVALVVRAEENPNEVIPQLQSAQKSNSNPKIQQNLKWILNAIEKQKLVKGTASTHRSELRQMPVSTTNLSAAEELEALQAFLNELKREQAEQNAGSLIRVSVFSDQHGTIDKFDALIVDSIRAADPRLPAAFKLIPPSLEGSAETSLEAQLRPHGISLTDLRGKLYFHNLGDLMDRGPYGVRVYQRSKELIQAGLSDFVIGNHDLWEFMNLQAFHLPWYEGYNFYGYSDRYDKSYGQIQDLVKRYHQESPETREKIGWVEKLAEFNDFHNQQQKKKWAGLEQVFNQSTEEIVTGQLETVKKKNAPKVYSLFGGLMTEKQQQMIGQFLGYNPKTDILIYTGIRAVGTVSIKWWEDLLAQFKAELKSLNKNTNTYKLWRVSIEFMEKEIIPGLRGQLEKQLAEGKWWWRAFEAINYQNYTSVEWWAKDWSSHKDWGTAVIDELNEGIDKNDARYVTQANYLKNPILLEIGDFFRDNFTLYVRDIYQNVYMHAFLPIDDDGRFHFTYKGVHYVGNGQGQEPSVWEGLDRITADVRNRKNSMSDIYEALSLVNEWYADNTTVAKVPDVVKAIAAFSAENLAQQNGFNRLFTGHLPFNEFNKQKAKFPETVKGFVVDEKFIFTDHGMGKRFGGRGARIDIRDQLQLRGYEHGDSTLLIANPRTVELKDGNEEILFVNPGIERKVFLGEVIQNVQQRIELVKGFVAVNGDSVSANQLLKALQQSLQSDDLSKARLLAQRLAELQRNALIKFYTENRNRREVLRNEAQKNLIKDVIAAGRSEVRVADHEAERARAYWKGELVTTPIDRPFRASRKEDVFDIVDDLSEEDAIKLEALAVASLLKGEGYISMLVAGASARMNTKEAPDEVKELVKNTKLKSKAAVPIGVSEEGKVTTYLGEFGENVARLFKSIDEEARKNRIESKVWENSIGLLSSEQYRDEHDRLLIENAFYGLSQHHVRFFHQPLGAKFVGTEKDVENLKDKFSSEEAYREALAYSRLSSEHFEKGNHHQLVLADERDPQGHGEYFHQLIVSGELLHMIDTGKKWGFAKNVDNYAAKFDKTWLRTLGLFLERGLDFQPEVSPRAPGQKGGSLIVMEDNKAHQLAEDPNIVATNKINEAKGLPIVKPTDSYWFNDAVAFFSIPYVMNIYKKEGQTDAEFIQELRKASREERELIANRGRKKFPSLVDPKPAKEQNAAAVKVETNMWQSTGVVGPEMKIAAVGVRGARNFPITQYAQMTPKQKEAELAKLRFLSTKQWTKTEKEVQDAREQMEKDLGRKVSDQELWITLETYEGNKIIAEDLLRYNRQAEFITPGAFDFLKTLNQILNTLKWWREQLFVSESTGIDLDLILDLDAAIENLENPATVNPQIIAAAVNLEEKLKNQFSARSELRAPKLTDTADKLQLGDSSLSESMKQQDDAEKTALGFKPAVVSQAPDSETQSGSSAGQILKMLIPLIRGEKGELTRQELESILSQSAIFMIMDNEQSPSVIQLGWIELKGNAKKFRYSNPPFTPESKNWQVISRVVNELRGQFGKKAGFISYEKFSDREKRKKIEPRLLDLKNNPEFERFNVASKILSLYLKDKGLPQRSELREVNPTTVFTNDFSEWKNIDRSSLEQVHPDLAAIRLTAEQTAASFYDIPALFTKLPETEVFDFLANVLVPDVLAGTAALEVLDAVRDALGPYAWLLDSGSSPVHITKVVEEKSIKAQDYIGLIALAAANQDQVTLVWKGGSEVQAQAIEAELEAQAKKLGVPDFANRFNVLGSDGANSVDSVRVIRQIAGSPAKLQIGTLDESLDFLQKLGYVRGLSRVHNADRLNDQTAILITAALLREQISNPYDIVNLQKWMQEKGIDAHSLVEHVGRMIQVLQHIATQA